MTSRELMAAAEKARLVKLIDEETPIFGKRAERITD